MNVCVFLGSSLGNDVVYVEHIKKLANWITNNRYKLVYGGANEGLMGILAQETKKNGGYIIGIQAKMYSKKEYIFDKLDEYYVVESISIRKDKLIETSDLFIAFPGGSGSLDEIAHTIETIKAKKLNKKLIIYNLNNYYDNLKKQIEIMIKSGFLDEKVEKFVVFVNDIGELTIV